MCSIKQTLAQKNPCIITVKAIVQGLFLFTSNGLLVKDLNFYTAGLHHILCQLIWIRISVDNALNTSVNEDFGAHYTGLMSAVQGATVHGNTMIGSLHHRILLRMNATTELVVLARGHLQLLTQAANLTTVGQVLRRTIIARGHDLAVFHNYSTHTATQTGGAF